MVERVKTRPLNRQAYRQLLNQLGVGRVSNK